MFGAFCPFMGSLPTIFHMESRSPARAHTFRMALVWYTFGGTGDFGEEREL